MSRFSFPSLSLALALALPLAPSAQGAAAATPLPDTPVGKALTLFVKALNSGSVQELERFHTDRGGSAEMAQQDLDFAQQSGGLDLQKVLKASDFDIEVEATARKTGRVVVLHFVIEPTPPHAVAHIGVRPAGARGAVGSSGSPSGPRGPEHAPRPAPDVIAAAPAVVDQAIAAGFSGAVLIAKDGKSALERASGFANRNFEVKNRIDTKFNLGSINKTFTKLAIAQLLEAGKLSLDDTLDRILPDFPNVGALAKVTVAHLIEMKSGIGDFFGREFDATPRNRIRTLSDYLPFFARKPLAFEPGTAEAYSNGGYLTLGLIIEKLSGRTYYDYVRERIFKAAGMNDTDSFETDAVVPNLAVGYTRRAGADDVSNVYSLPGRGSSAGGGYSTAPDMLKYAEALLANQLASASYTAWCLGGPRPDPKMKASPMSAPLHGALGIAGGSPGVNAVFEVNAAQRLVVVVLANQDGPAAEDLARRLRLGR